MNQQITVVLSAAKDLAGLHNRCPPIVHGTARIDKVLRFAQDDVRGNENSIGGF